MSDPRLTELIHGEIDGVLDTAERAELARQLLADPAARGEREALRRLCGLLDGAGQSDPPADLPERILAALPPQRPRGGLWAPVLQPWSTAHRWRYAAVAAGVLVAGAIVFTTVRGPGALGDLAGTMADSGTHTPLDEAVLAREGVSGRVGLYRHRRALQVKLQIMAPGPVDVLVTAGGQTRRIRGLGGHAGGAATTITLPETPAAPTSVDVTVLMAGREIGRATLRASGSP
ncbi:MAG: hypothetical protein JSR67_06885 [Proteobacteria bacterium]|nr:hypothetical protein [Pseudomonadota bacterium]